MRKYLAMAGILFAGVLAAEPPFTLEQVMSKPFPENLVAAPAGGKIAWEINVRGARNIWVAGPPDYRGRQLTTFAQDDGQEISQMAWTPDGRSLVFVRGGDFEMRREVPNPRSSPEVIEQALWLVSVDGGTPRKLGEGYGPAISPKGDRVAFLYKGQVWWASLNSEAKAEQAVHARGTTDALRWSPDGSKLAFVSDRGDQSFIAVFDTAVKSLRYVDPSVDRDGSPVWSPDSSAVAFIRIPATREAFAFGPKRTADEPWSIRMAEVASGHGRQVWRAEPGRGSEFHGIVATSQLMWAEGRLVFPWERTGWAHLYSIPVSGAAADSIPLTGGAALELTPGEFEVEHVALAPNGREVIFSSNQGDADRRHLWKVTIDRAGPPAITKGEGIEWSPIETSDGESVAFFHSDARRPARAAVIMGSNAAKDLAPAAVPADFPAEQLAQPEPVIFSAADGIRIHGQLFLPRHMQAGERRPAVIFFHGGSRRQMLLGWHYMYYYNNA